MNTKKVLILIILSSLYTLLSIFLCCLKKSNIATIIAIYSCVASIIGIYLIYHKIKPN